MYKTICLIYILYIITDMQYKQYIKGVSMLINICSHCSLHPSVGELRRLRLLVCSYQDDERFAGVDFGQAHSRFAHLIVGALRPSTTPAGTASSDSTSANADAAAPALAAAETDWQRIRGELQYARDTVAALNVPANGPTPADEDLHCVLVNVLHYMDGEAELSVPCFAAGLTEQAARALWTAEERCRCVWSLPGGVAEADGRPVARHQQQQLRHLRRMAKRMDQQQPSQPEADNGGTTPQNGWQCRQTLQQLDSDDEDDDDDDESYLVSNAFCSVRCISKCPVVNYVFDLVRFRVG